MRRYLMRVVGVLIFLLLATQGRQAAHHPTAIQPQAPTSRQYHFEWVTAILGQVRYNFSLVRGRAVKHNQVESHQ